NYVLKVRVASPAALEQLLADLRASAHVTTRTTVVLSIPYENRSPEVRPVDNGDSIGEAEDPAAAS
ncbi:MAG: Lrp/AsnC family transcriptional regulator, partial [Actinomycetes bacterium]